MEQANPVSTPAEPNAKKNLPEAKQIDKRIERSYRQLVGALTYLAVATRPDIAYVTSYLGQFNHNHTEEHWSAAKRVLRYLRGTINLGLHFRHSLDPVVGYTDADWGECQGSKIVYGLCFLAVCSYQLAIIKTAYGSPVIDRGGIHGTIRNR